MKRYALDTDIVGLIQQAHPMVLQRLASLDPEDEVFTTVVTPLRVEYVPKAGVVVEKRGRANDPGTPLRVEYVPKGEDSA